MSRLPRELGGTGEFRYVDSNKFFQRLWRPTASSLHHVGYYTEDTILMVLGYVRQVGRCELWDTSLLN